MVGSEDGGRGPQDAKLAFQVPQATPTFVSSQRWDNKNQQLSKINDRDA